MGCLVLTSALVLSGCASRVTTEDRYSGFLQSYGDLKETTSASGAPILRWISPDFDPQNYKALLFEPVRFYPQAKPTEQVSADVLNGILTYTNTKLKQAAEQRLPLVTKPGPGVLEFRGAITAVDTSDQDLRAYELIPVALVIAGTRAAAGARPKDTNLYFEGELLDSVTKKPLVKIVRKGQGTQVAGSTEQVTLDDLKTVIDGMATDTTMFGVVKQ